MARTQGEYSGEKTENFSIDNGELFYVGRKKGDKPRRVIKTEEERQQILENCHGQTEGSIYFVMSVRALAASICMDGIIWERFYNFSK